MIGQAIRGIDLFGHEIGFEHKESQSLKSYQGAAISFISIATIIIISFIFGQELYQRKNPNVAQSKEKIEESIISFKEFPFFLSIIDNNGTPRRDARSYIDIFIDKLTIGKDGVVSYGWDFKMDDCKNQFKNFEGPIAEMIKEDASININLNLCVNLDHNKEELFVRNDFGTNDSSFVRLRAVPCYLNMEIYRETECLLKKGDPYPFYPVTVFGAYDSYVTSTKFDKPVLFTRKTDTQNLDMFTENVVYHTITNDALITDRGWLLEDKVTENYYHMYNRVTSFNLSEVPGINIVLTTSMIRNKIERNYMKAQELFAKIGGFANAIFIVARLLSMNYLRFLYLVFIHRNSIKPIIHDNKNLKNEIRTCVVSNKFKQNENSNNSFLSSLNVSEVQRNKDNNENNDKNRILNNFVSEVSRSNNSNNSNSNDININNNRNNNNSSLENNNTNKVARLIKAIHSPENPKLLHLRNQEKSFLLGLDETTTAEKNNETSLKYSTYLRINICFCCKNTEIKRVYKQELERVKLLINFSTFTRYMTEQYCLKYAV